MNYRIQDLIDIPLFQSLQDKLNEIYSFPSAIIDNEGNVLTATAWQDVCTKFHRLHPECEKECRTSDLYILEHLDEAKPAVTYRCPHGLVDNATPIVIGGRHLGNYFTGQFFLAPPDLEFFRAQARKYGFDEQAYLDAVARVPVWSEEKLHQYLDFIKGFTEILAGIGLKQLQEREARRLLAERGTSVEEDSLVSQQIFDSVDEGVIVYGPDLRYRLWNPYMERLSGMAAAEVIGRHPLELFPFLKETGVIDRVVAALRGEMPLANDFMVTTPSGGTRWTSDTTAPLFAQNGAIIGAIATVRDITERRRAEDILQENEARYRVLFEAGRDAMLLIDAATGEIVDANHSAVRLYGWSRAELRGKSITELNLLTPEKVRAEMQAAMREERSWFAFRHRRANGSVADVEVHSGPVSVGGRTMLLSSIRDVTERIHLEQEVEQQRIRAAEVDRLQALGEMATSIAHELNQPLNGIRTFAEGTLIGLRNDWELTRGQLQETMTDIIAQVDRMTEIIDHMRIFSRNQSQRGAVAFQVPAAIAGALKLMGAQLRVHGITVKQELEANLPCCQGWENSIEQVIINLLSNARDALDERLQRQKTGGPDAMPAWRPEITIRTTAASVGESIRLEVRDNGGGIPADVAARIFDPFFTTKEVGKGTGIGLAIVRSIVDKHRGRIEVDNRPGEGVTFAIVLPVAAALRDSSAASPADLSPG